MPSIDLKQNLQLSAMTVAPLVLQVLQDIHDGRKPFVGYALRLRLQDDKATSVGSVEVPVAVTAANASGYPPYEIALTLEATAHKHLFPAFDGKLLTSALSSALTQVELVGTYHPPLGVLGAALDATGLAGAARRSLEEFLTTLVDAVNERMSLIASETARNTMRSAPRY